MHNTSCAKIKSIEAIVFRVTRLDRQTQTHYPRTPLWERGSKSKHTLKNVASLLRNTTNTNYIKYTNFQVNIEFDCFPLKCYNITVRVK